MLVFLSIISIKINNLMFVTYKANIEFEIVHPRTSNIDIND